MFGTQARRLAVASLTEAGDAATALWRRSGQPLQGYVLVTGEGTDCRVTVYVQQGDWGPTAVLAGDMVWFQSPAEGAAEPPDAPGRAPEPEPEPEPEPVVDSEPAPPEEEPAEIGFKLYPEPATPVTAFPAHKIEVIVTPVDGGLTAPDAPQPPPPDPDLDPAPDSAPDPDPDSAPDRGDSPTALLSRHPLAPRARGSARVDPAQGNMTIAAWGLPSASQLGPSYNAYRAWLLNQRAGTRESLGLLTRAWGDNYRLVTDGELPLSRYDAIIITAEDRRAPIAHQNPPQVLFGAYR